MVQKESRLGHMRRRGIDNQRAAINPAQPSMKAPKKSQNVLQLFPKSSPETSLSTETSPSLYRFMVSSDFFAQHFVQDHGMRQKIQKQVLFCHGSSAGSFENPQGASSIFGFHCLKVYSPLVSSYMCYARTVAVPHGSYE